MESSHAPIRPFKISIQMQGGPLRRPIAPPDQGRTFGPPVDAYRFAHGVAGKARRTARDTKEPRGAMSVGSSGGSEFRTWPAVAVVSWMPPAGRSGFGDGCHPDDLRPGGAEQTWPAWSRSFRRGVLHLAQAGHVRSTVCGRRWTGWRLSATQGVTSWALRLFLPTNQCDVIRYV